ncbi:unnamed protein product [Clavelina lepadiformis]|uniref:C-type lectin domain-containing protein n=1 Tax=Clavelina lepadiformis TaxID=159417 RepID=A0ABP0FKB7_CLALP
MFFVLLLCVISLPEIRGQSNEICLSLSRGQDDFNSREMIQGPPGRRGPPGLPGPVGDVGQPGRCDLHDIEELRSQIQDSCIGGVKYHNSCIKLAYLNGAGVDYAEAVKLCAEKNASLAEITSDRMFDLAVNYINRTWGEFSHRSDLVDIWLGMTYEGYPQKELTSSSTGTRIMTKRWFPNYPSSYATRTHVMIEAGLIAKFKTGIFNTEPSTKGVPLCSYANTSF